MYPKEDSYEIRGVTTILLMSKIFCLLPLWLALFIGRCLGWVWYYLIPVRRSIARENVRRVLGRDLTERDQRRIVRRSFENLAMNVIETLRAPIMTKELSTKLVERQGVSNIEAAWSKGKGVLYVLTHIGNVDMIGFSQPGRGLPLHGVVKEIHWAPAQKFIKRVREATGLKLIPPKRSKGQIRDVLAQNEMIGLIVDQNLNPRHAIVCEFFGMLASTSPAPARFGFETGAPILPAVIFRQGNSGHHLLRIEPEFILETPYPELDANIRHNTERLNRIVERWVREAPHQWLWAHRRWKVQDDPSGWEIPESLSHLLTP